MKQSRTLQAAVLACGMLVTAASSAGGASAEALGITCAGCHGTNGVSAGPAPTIAGLSPDYFMSVMQGYRSGDNRSTIMQRIAKGYTDEQLELMAGFFAKKKFVAAKQKFDAKLAKKGAKYHDKYCEKCHSDGGSVADDDAGILAGQWAPYMDWTLQDARDGSRVTDKKMVKKIKKLIKKEGDAATVRAALVNYYASQQ